MQREHHTNEQLQQLSEWLQALPNVEKSRPLNSRMEVVRRLQPDIQSALKRGYTHEQIADGLSGQGVRISAGTLRNYLQRAKPAGAKRAYQRSTNDGEQRGIAREGAKKSASPTTTRATKAALEPSRPSKSAADFDSAEFMPRPDRLKL
jgi:hypothetical protein